LVGGGWLWGGVWGGGGGGVIGSGEFTDHVA